MFAPGYADHHQTHRRSFECYGSVSPKSVHRDQESVTIIAPNESPQWSDMLTCTVNDHVPYDYLTRLCMVKQQSFQQQISLAATAESDVSLFDFLTFEPLQGCLTDERGGSVGTSILTPESELYGDFDGSPTYSLYNVGANHQDDVGSIYSVEPCESGHKEFRRRTAGACTFCCRRKLKCDSKERCSQCIRRKRVCQYSEAAEVRKTRRRRLELAHEAQVLLTPNISSVNRVEKPLLSITSFDT